MNATATCRAVCCAVILAALPFAASATVFRMLSGDFTAINADWSASENGRTFTTVESGSPSAPLISTERYAGTSSIQVQVPTDNTGNKQRFEYTIAHASDPDGLHFDNARYSGFAFKLGTPAAGFGSSTLFWQAWQGSPWGPPASLKLTAGDSAPYTIGLYIRNMTNGPDSAVSDTRLWSSAMVQPDQWYAVVIYLAPRYTNGNGNIKLWINGTNYVDWTGNIGYDPSLVAGAYDGLDVKNGIYQPNANNGHTMFFDQIMLADTFAEAAALPSPANTPPTASTGTATLRRNTVVDFDLSTLVDAGSTPASQCLFSVTGATNGTAALLADGHTARFLPASNFVGMARFSYTVTGCGEDPRALLHYGFAPASSLSQGYVTDNSGHFRDGQLRAVGTGTFAPATNSPLPLYLPNSLALAAGTNGGACLSRFISNPAEFNFSDRDWTFGGWFERAELTNHDFLLYFGSDNGFGGSGDELQLYCPNGSPTLAVQHYSISNALDVSAASAPIVGAGQWHHAALVFQRTDTSAGVLRAYLDGVAYDGTNVSWLVASPAPLVFGGHNSTNSGVDRWFNGWLSDLVLFTNALTATEIARLASGTVAHFGGLSATNTVNLTVTNYARPTLSDLHRTNNAWRMTVNGDAGPDYILQASANLTAPAWLSIATNPLAAPPFVFLDATASVESRFYRVVVAP
jgi:hypothetical protein